MSPMSNSTARKRDAGDTPGRCGVCGNTVAPSVAALEQARAEGAAEVRARVQPAAQQLGAASTHDEWDDACLALRAALDGDA